jgi:hypothetical protein
LIGRIVDLDLLSLFPQEDARIIGGIERKQAPKVQQWWGKTCLREIVSIKKKVPLNRCPRFPTVKAENAGTITSSKYGRYDDPQV